MWKWQIKAPLVAVLGSTPGDSSYSFGRAEEFRASQFSQAVVGFISKEGKP
jgi:hypothetical protein